VAFRAFDSLPAGERLYYLTQRYVTRTLPRDLAHQGRWPFEHVQTFRRHFAEDLSSARLFEFGAGWDLYSNLVQWCYGLNHQLVVDISRLIRLDLLNRVIRYLHEHPPSGFVRVPETPLTEPVVASLEQLYGIRYAAPADARRTGLVSASVDLVCTTSVLEHIPATALADIMRECRRLCHPGSVISHVVDYSDHYAHSDAAISFYNFLRFSDDEWTPYNPPIHYQNRLRHFEYGQLFADAGFEAVAQTIVRPDGAAEVAAAIPLSSRFRAMTLDQLTPITGHWVLRPR